jgi:hypothetical protein
MYIEDYISIISSKAFKMGTSKNALASFSYFIEELVPEDLINTDPNVYILGEAKLANHKVVTYRSYINNKGRVVDLICHGTFETYGFWNYENLDDDGVQKLKERFPGSAHVKLHGAQLETRLEEFIDNLKAYNKKCKKRNFNGKY